MKIIKEGKKTTTMRVTCGTCEAELEITYQDLTMHFAQLPIRWGYKCPCCNKENYLLYSQLPKAWQKYG